MQREAATKLTALTARPDLIHLSDAISVAICMPGVAAGVPAYRLRVRGAVRGREGRA